ncbi:hypothetical protein TWF718_004222 [Orbilia javanica]|uniref:Uncharacterized protein n=1 Tax=Orbilia javanica TaxID=47235 RepID=A0AAN8MRZ0_9PEZI
MSELSVAHPATSAKDPIDTPTATECIGPENEERKTPGEGDKASAPRLKILTGNDAPWPGNSYIISYQNTSKVLTFEDKNVVLAEYEGKATQRWACHSRDGWLGFANDPGDTTRWLGISTSDQADSALVAKAVSLSGGLNGFCIMKRPEDGFLILKKVNERLRPIGTGPDGSLSIRSNWGHWWAFTRIS